MRSSLSLVVAAAMLSAACEKKSSPDGAHQPTGSQRLAVIEHLAAPEALSYDSVHDVFLVSNVNGNPQVKDGNGFISRIRSDGTMDSLHFIQGGRNGVVLNGPMGSRVRGDTLWVVDIDALRAFDTRSGAPLRSIDLSPVAPLFTNDIAFGPGGDVYITDTGVRVKPDGSEERTHIYRILRVDRTGKVSVALESPALQSPDGIDWDARRGAFVLAPIGGPAIQTWRPGEPAPVDVVRGAGRFDGLEIERDGRVLFTSWADSSVSELRGAIIVRLLGPVGAPPADVSMDTRRGRLGIVSLAADRFELWTLAPAR